MMNKENLFVYEDDGFCELRYTYGDLTKFEREAKKYNKLQSNWNSLKEWIKENSWYYSTSDGCQWIDQFKLLDKMNELEKKYEKQDN